MCVCVCMIHTHVCVCMIHTHVCACMIYMSVCVCMNPQGLNVEQVRNREVERQRRLAASGSHSDVIPAVCVCVEGGVGTIRTVHAAVTRGTPVVVVKVRVAVCCSVLQCVAVCMRQSRAVRLSSSLRYTHIAMCT